MTDTLMNPDAAATAGHPGGGGSAALAIRFRRDGYLVLADALATDEVQALLDEAVRICRGELGAVAGAARWSTTT